MTWAINDNWLRASEQKGVRVIGLVTIELQQTTALYLQNYADLVGTGCLIVLNIDGTNYTVEEGVEWNASGSNEATAIDIGDAMLAAVAATGEWNIRYWVEANVSGANLTFLFGEAAYASSALTFQASFVDEPANVLTDLGNGPTEARFCKSHEPFVGTAGVYPNLVQDIRGLEMSVDPLTREIAIGSPEFDLSDTGSTSGIRALMKRYMMLAKAVDLRVGFDGLAETDFEAWPRVYIQKITPKIGGPITLQCGDGLYELTSSKIQGEWVCKHPLELVEDLLNRCVLPDRYDAASLDPEDADYDSIGHWCVSRYNDEVYQLMNGIDEPTPALDVLNSVLVMLNGTLKIDQTGAYAFSLLDESASAIRLFENAADLSPTGYPCRVTAYSDAFENLTNVATMNFAQSRDASTGLATYREMDNASVRECLRLVETTLDLEWCNAVAEIYGAYMEPGAGGTEERRMFPDPDTAQYVIKHAPRQGFCGTRQAYDATVSSFGPYANSALAVGREAFHRVEGNAYADTSVFNFTRDPEIVAVDSVDHFFFPPQRLDSELINRNTQGASYADSGIVGGVIPGTEYNPLAYTWTDAVFLIASTYSGYDFVNGRAGLGTTSAAARDGGVGTDVDDPTLSYFKPFRVVDITIPVDIAKRWIRRARFGMPKQTIEVGARHYDLELSDFVQMSADDTFLGFQQPQLDNTGSSVFEITRKRCRLFEADPCMEFDISFLKSTIYPAASVVPFYDPTVGTVSPVELSFIVDNTNNMVTNDQDADGIAESYTIEA